MTILKKGSKGASVKALQTLINQTELYFKKLNPDGDFGNETDRAVRHVQGLLGLLVDGKVGVNTMTALKRKVQPVKASARPEPVKAAMNTASLPLPPPVVTTVYMPPPNLSSLKLGTTDRKITEIIVHCTATPEGKHFTVDDVRAWHKARGFSDVGYHYLVYPDGRIMLGRPVGQIGSHVQGHNTGTIGISYFGGLTADTKSAKDTRTDAQRSSLLWLVDQLTRQYPVTKVTGHNLYAAKACPCFDVAKDQLSQLARAA